MINNLMKIFNQNWKFRETMPMDFLVEDAGDCYRLIIKNMCAWYCRGGGCTMCNYSDRTGFKATEVITDNEDIIIENLVNLNKNHEKLKLYINGSFFNEDELNFNVAINFISKIKIKLGIKKICVESRPEFVNFDKLKNYIVKTNLEFEVCFGIESTNDIVRNTCLNKGINIEDFYSLVNQLEKLCSIKVYLLIKPPFLSEKQAIDDVVNSVNELVGKGIKNISYTPIAVQNNTILEFLLQEKMYRPVWVWSLIEINTRLKSIREKKPQIHLSGLDYFPQPIISAYNCDRCSRDLLELLKINRNLMWEDIESFINCECYQKWYNEINDSSSIESAEKQIQIAIDMLNKTLDRTKQIKNRTGATENVEYLTDIAKTMPIYNIALDYVGIENLRIPTRIKGYADSVATCSSSIELDEFHRGIHMSRLVEQLNSFAGTFHENLLDDMENLVRFNGGINSELKIECTLLKKIKTPRTNKNTFADVTLNIAVQLNKRNIFKNVEISVPFINACPCTLITAKELFNGSFTHTQKGTIKITFCNVSISFEEMLAFAESYISIFDMLKREDEIYVVKTAFDSAAFCEDICREISKESFTRFRGKGGTIKVKVVTDESIHPHRAFAKKEILL